MDSYSKLLRARYGLWISPEHLLPDNGVRAEKALLSALNNKFSGAKLVEEIGIETPCPRLFLTPAAALAEPPSGAFVLKPLSGTMSGGVRILYPEGEGWHCVMTDRRYATLRAVVAELPEVPVIIEKMVIDVLGYTPACDYKIYATKVGCPLIQQRYAPIHLPRDQYSFEFYDRKGNALGPIRQNTQAGITVLRKPDNLEAAFEAAEKIMEVIDVSFVRIDGYLSADGFVFGEFTPAPTAGRYGFNGPQDQILGKAWAESIRMMDMDYSLPLSSRVAQTIGLFERKARRYMR